MATIRMASDGSVVFNFDHSEVTSIMGSEDVTVYCLGVLGAAFAVFYPDPLTKAIIGVAIGGVAATIKVHQAENSRCRPGLDDLPGWPEWELGRLGIHWR